jgi:hypothetical protein
MDAFVAPPDMGMDVGTDAPSDANVDVGTDTAVDAGRDANTITSCNMPSLVGAHCASGACMSGVTCAAFAPMTVQAAFGLSQGSPDPAHTGYSVLESPPIVSESAPFTAAAGTLCAQTCDTAAASDTCGACTSCANVLTQMPLIAAFGGVRTIYGAAPPFGADTGLCRLDCTWQVASSGTGCPDSAMTCDAFSGTCIEACTTDNECNTTYGITYNGDLTTALVTTGAEHCDHTTGRCEANGTPTATVGRACTSSDQCVPRSGICLNGGLCAELGCVPGPLGASLCGASAICLATNNTPSAVGLCLRACNTRADCGPGNACQQLGTTVGGFTGYCLGTCAMDTDCAANETCTDTTGAGGPVAGRCVPRCTGVGLVGAASGGCTATQYCRIDHAGATYGSCVDADAFCGAVNTMALPAADPTECATGYVCDETLATPHLATGAATREQFGDGHCAPTCTTCTGGQTCVSSGPLAGLCRRACSAASPSCPTDQTCNTALGYCVEVATM